MSMDLMVQAMKIKVGNPLRKLVLLKLADNASDRGECWPSYQHIADQCEISKRSVMNHIDALCDCGMLKKELRKGPKGNSSNVYRITLHSAGDSLGGSAGADLHGAGDSPHGAGDSPHSAGDSLGGSAGDSPGISHSFEPVNEPVNEPLKPIGTSAGATMPSRSAKQEYSQEFESAWQTYPKRAGGNPKNSAYKAWNARLREGVTPETMLEGVKRYAAFVTATGKSGSEYVKQAATFFGPDKHFNESWQAPQASGGVRAVSQHTGFSSRDYGETNIPAWAREAKS